MQHTNRPVQPPLNEEGSFGLNVLSLGVNSFANAKEWLSNEIKFARGTLEDLSRPLPGRAEAHDLQTRVIGYLEQLIESVEPTAMINQRQQTTTLRDTLIPLGLKAQTDPTLEVGTALQAIADFINKADYRTTRG